MKKTLLMMAVALTAWSASAQLYVTGGAVEGAPAAWDPANPLEVTAVNGEYTFKATGDFKISTAKGTWDGFNSGAYTLDGSWNAGETTATAQLKQGQNDIAAAKAGVVVTYTVKDDLSSISASFSAGEVEKYYQLHGQIFGDPNWSSEAMTKNGDNWEWTGNISVAGEFGMKVCDAAGNQIDWIGGAATVTEEAKSYSFVTGGNSSCTLTGNYTVVYNPTAQTIEFNSDGGSVTPPTPSTDLVLSGSFNGWAPNDAAYKMTANGNTYTYTMDSLDADAEFKVKVAEDSWGTSWGAEGDPSATEAQPVTVTPNIAMNAWAGSGCNFKVADVLYNVTITFVKSDDTSVASTLTVAGTSAIEAVEAAAIEVPAEYYNLQGVRILSPEAGQLYIVNRAGKVSKEIAR